MDRKFALFTGANKGIGFEAARQLARRGVVVFLGCRDKDRGIEAEKVLQREDLDCYFLSLDVTSSMSVGEAVRQIDSRCNGVDILINNAGVMLDRSETITRIGADQMLQTLNTNVVGALAVSQACLPAMRRKNYGRIVNVSSSLGTIAKVFEGEAQGTMSAYKISKLALNAVTTLLAKELAGTNILVNAVCPGWVKTDMGGIEAPRKVEEGAENIVSLAFVEDGGPTGAFFSYYREPRSW